MVGIIPGKGALKGQLARSAHVNERSFRVADRWSTALLKFVHQA